MVIALPSFNPLKETAEQRKARVQQQKPMSTIVSKNKKKYNRHPKHRQRDGDYSFSSLLQTTYSLKFCEKV